MGAETVLGQGQKARTSEATVGRGWRHWERVQNREFCVPVIPGFWEPRLGGGAGALRERGV